MHRKLPSGRGVGEGFPPHPCPPGEGWGLGQSPKGSNHRQKKPPREGAKGVFSVPTSTLFTQVPQLLYLTDSD